MLYALNALLYLCMSKNSESITEVINTKLEAIRESFPASERDRVEGMVKATMLSVMDLLTVHWKNIDELLLDDEKARGSFSLGIKLDMGEGDKKSRVTAKISYAKRTSDSVEMPVDNTEAL